MIEYGESTTNQLHLVLLDWERAYGKVGREEMFNAMAGMDIDEQLRRLVKQSYKHTTSKAENRRTYFRLAKTRRRNQTRMSTIPILISYSYDSNV